ncbi:MAG: SRPBCC family protein [Solirubrobacteraceae bacterium]
MRVVDVRIEQHIARPREAVAHFVMNPANDRDWIGALTEVRVLTDGEVGPGTQVERVASFLGRRLRYVTVIAEYRPGHGLAMHSVQAPFPLDVEYDFVGEPGGTRARVRATGDPGRYYRLAGPLLGLMVKAGIRRDLRRLRALLEARAPGPQGA